MLNGSIFLREFDFLSNSDTEEFSEDDLPLAKTYPLE